MRNNNCICVVCAKPTYRNPNSMPEVVTCSKECRRIYHNTNIRSTVVCDTCGKLFTKKPSRAESNNHFCSASCSVLYRSISYSPHDAAWLRHVGYYDWQIAKFFNCSRTWVLHALNSLGYVGRRSKISDINLRKRISQTNTGKRTGVDNHRYKGRSTYTSLARGLFNAISRQVRADRNYTCEYCSTRGGDMHVHHRYPFSSILDDFLSINPNIPIDVFSYEIIKYPPFYDTSNLVLVCAWCHKALYH